MLYLDVALLSLAAYDLPSPLTHIPNNGKTLRRRLLVYGPFYVFLLGIVQDVIHVRLYREIGLLDVGLIVLVWMVAITLANSKVRMPKIIVTWTIMLGLWLMWVTAVGINHYGVEQQWPGGYLHFMRTIVIIWGGFVLGACAGYYKRRLDSFERDQWLITPWWAIAVLVGWAIVVASRSESLWDLTRYSNIPDSGMYNWNAVSLVLATICLVTVPAKSARGKWDYVKWASFLGSTLVIVLSTSRTAAAVLCAAILLSPLTEKFKYTLKSFALVTVAAVGLLVIAQNNSAIALVEKIAWKYESIMDNLITVRFSEMIVNQATAWLASGNVLWGDGVSWGHNHVLTVALKTGWLSAAMYVTIWVILLRFYVQECRERRYLYRWLGIIALMFVVASIGDYIFTVPVYAYLLFLVIGWGVFPDIRLRRRGQLRDRRAEVCRNPLMETATYPGMKGKRI